MLLGRGSKKRTCRQDRNRHLAPIQISGAGWCADGSVRIDGVCEEGVIETAGNIVVGPQAKVAADLIAENVSVSGAVTGKIKASGRLEILSTGKVWGDVGRG